MEVIRTIQPGKPGSVRFFRRWGNRLVAVRYRRDRQTMKTCTTVELIVEERGDSRARIPQAFKANRQREEIVALPIAFREHELRASAKQAGAHWCRTRKVWLMRYHVAVELGIQDRVLHDHIQENK